MNFTLPNVFYYTAVANVMLATVLSMFYLSFFNANPSMFSLVKIYYTIQYVAGYVGHTKYYKIYLILAA